MSSAGTPDTLVTQTIELLQELELALYAPNEGTEKKEILHCHLRCHWTNTESKTKAYEQSKANPHTTPLVPLLYHSSRAEYGASPSFQRSTPVL